MQTSTIATTLIATLTLLQGVPAPGLPIAIGLGAAASAGATAGAAAGAASSGITAGIISGAVGAGPGPAPAEVPQYNWDECYYAARGAQITVTGPVGDSHIRVVGVPAVCMNLATVMTGAPQGDVGRAQSCGSDCSEYVNMTPEYYENMRALINTQVPMFSRSPWMGNDEGM
ncbi:hypothetical protein CSOJ01_13474 [Colletotrichum sojae]|uniref:Uncharacterized protein n=1 Tax=Colletotrichum sojae TaxID=2175907 RepID=A0A8H6MLB3_9PEZI|nr:hypothetical protein CSOJ01_13474 [Colletotrichum sojae]